MNLKSAFTGINYIKAENEGKNQATVWCYNYFMDQWTKIPNNQIVEQTATALIKNGIETFVVKTGDEAKNKFFELVPEGSEVFSNTSVTLDTLGINKEINESGKYVSLKNKVSSMPGDTPEQRRNKKMVGSVPQYAVGSVHAVTSDGHLMIASGSGSQLPGYTYGADHIVLVIGAQKLVKDINEGIKRIYEHSLPLESERINKVYNITAGSTLRRILIFNSENEMNKNRTKIIIVKEVLGF